MRWFRNDPADGDAAHAPDAPRPWWSEPSDAAGVPPLEPDFDAIVGGGLPPAPGPEAYVPVFAPAADAGATEQQYDDADADGAASIDAAPIHDPAPINGPAPSADAAPNTEPEETAVPVGIDEGTDADVAIEPLDLPEDADAAPSDEAAAPEGDVVGHPEDTLPPAPAPEPGAEDDADEVHVPVVELGLSFGERIERLIAAAVTEADHTRADAQHEAEQLVQSARLDAEHAVAAAQRQSAEIVAATQRRCDDELAAAQRTRAEAEQALADAREEAENLRRRVRDEVAEMRQEIDLHAQAMLARTRADTNRTLASARAELEEIALRKAELEEQMSSIRALLSDAVVEPLPQDLTELLGRQAEEATEPGNPAEA